MLWGLFTSCSEILYLLKENCSVLDLTKAKNENDFSDQRLGM